MSIDSYRFLDFASCCLCAGRPNSPFVWPESPAQARNASKDLPPPPIVELLTKKPWSLVNLYNGRIPKEASVA
jgi:hypothetical protein